MKDINDIFSKNMIKVAQNSNLRFDEPIFETPISKVDMADDVTENPNPTLDSDKKQVPNLKKEEIVSKIPEDHVPKKFVDIISEQLGDQTSFLMEAYRRLNLIQADNPSLDLDSIKRLVGEALSATKIIKDRSFGVRVI